MRESRLRWYGDVFRVAPENLASIAYNFDVAGRRHRGSSKMWWLDTLNADVNASNCTRKMPSTGTNGEQLSEKWTPS